MKTKNNTEDEFLRLVGARVREARKKFGLSQEKLSEMASIHPTFVSHIECGKSNASICVYRRIAAALRVPLINLLDINQQKIEPDPMTKTLYEVKNLTRREQKLILETIKGMLAGMKRERGEK